MCTLRKPRIIAQKKNCMGKKIVVGSLFALLLLLFSKKSKTGDLHYTADEDFFLNTWDWENRLYDFDEVETVQFQKKDGVQTINSRYIVPRIVPNSLTISADIFKTTHEAQPLVYVIPDKQLTVYDVDSSVNLHVNKDDGFIRFRFILEIYSPKTAIGNLTVETLEFSNIKIFYYGQDYEYRQAFPVFYEYVFDNDEQKYKIPMVNGSDQRQEMITNYWKRNINKIQDGKNYFLIEFLLPVFWRINKGVTRARDKYPRTKQDDYSIVSLGQEDWIYQIGFENKNIPYREYLTHLNFVSLYFQLGLKVEEGTYQKFNLMISESNGKSETKFNPDTHEVTSTQKTKYMTISDSVFPYNRDEFKELNINTGKIQNLTGRNYYL